MENKQIEEMANEIYETLMLEAECPLSGMDCAIIADLLVKKGYRKTSDIAREIFAEIGKMKLQKDFTSRSQDFEFGYKIALADIAELKKKYEENKG